VLEQTIDVSVLTLPLLRPNNTQAHLDSSVRAVVLTGSGAHFTSGLDLAETGQMLVKLIGGSAVDAARRAFKVESLIRKYQASFTAIEKCSVPVISAIQVRAVARNEVHVSSMLQVDRFSCTAC